MDPVSEGLEFQVRPAGKQQCHKAGSNLMLLESICRGPFVTSVKREAAYWSFG